MKKKWVWGMFVPLFLLEGCAGPSRLDYPALQEPSRGIYHEVQKGETLWRIGHSYQVPVETLASVNKLSNPSQIRTGQLLFIPTVSVPRPVHASLAPSLSPPKPKTPGKVQFVWPVEGKIVSHFGEKTPLGKNRGIDIAGREGELVLAAAEGAVTFAGEKLKGFGKTVILDHGQFQTVYAHNEEILVKQGDAVHARQPIARLGRTGRVQQPTLHFEIRRGPQPLNPVHHLSRGR